MDIKRYVIIQAIKTKENELIPIWDERVVFEKTEMYGNILKLKNDYSRLQQLVECIYDIKERKLSIGVELDCYPDRKNLKYKEGEEVLVEVKNKILREDTIKEIVFEEYELTIKKGKKIEKYEIKDLLVEQELQPNQLYAIKHWKPYYILESGEKVVYDYKLYRKLES